MIWYCISPTDFIICIPTHIVVVFYTIYRYIIFKQIITLFYTHFPTTLFSPCTRHFFLIIQKFNSKLARHSPHHFFKLHPVVARIFSTIFLSSTLDYQQPNGLFVRHHYIYVPRAVSSTQDSTKLGRIVLNSYFLRFQGRKLRPHARACTYYIHIYILCPRPANSFSSADLVTRPPHYSAQTPLRQNFPFDHTITRVHENPTRYVYRIIYPAMHRHRPFY